MATWTDFELQQALRQMQPNGGSQNIGGYWVSPQYGNQYWEGQGENSQQVAGAPTEYQVTKDLGNANGPKWGGGGSAQYENAAYDRYGADGKFLGSDKYQDMGTDGFTKAMAYLTALAGAGGLAATVAGAGGAAAAGGVGSSSGAAGLGSDVMAGWGSSLAEGGTGLGLTGGTDVMAGWGSNLAGGAGNYLGGGMLTGVGNALPAVSLPNTPNAPKTPGSSLVPGVSNSTLAGAATTLLGAASGAGGGSGGAGGGRELDPRMEAYLYDANGLMPMTQGLLQRQAPIAEQNSLLLGDKARGLLGRGIATNPFLRG